MHHRVWLSLVLTAAFAGPAAHAADADGHFKMLETYCMECHNATDWAGGIAMDTLTPEGIPSEAQTWEKVVSRTRGGLMPPPGEPRPKAQELKTFIAWVEGTLDKAAIPHTDPGYVSLHRLNRREYTNAVESLLGLRLDPSSLLPQDDYSDGFDNVAKVLQVSPSFLDQYLAAARNVALMAVGNPAARPAGTP